MRSVTISAVRAPLREARRGESRAGVRKLTRRDGWSSRDAGNKICCGLPSGGGGPPACTRYQDPPAGQPPLPALVHVRATAPPVFARVNALRVRGLITVTTYEVCVPFAAAT